MMQPEELFRADRLAGDLSNIRKVRIRFRQRFAPDESRRKLPQQECMLAFNDSMQLWAMAPLPPATSAPTPPAAPKTGYRELDVLVAKARWLQAERPEREAGRDGAREELRRAEQGAPCSRLWLHLTAHLDRKPATARATPRSTIS
jgi:hypothetical protein